MTERGTKIRGPLLRKLRTRLSLTQTELGEAIGLSEVRIRHIESAEDARMFPTPFRKLAEVAKMELTKLRETLGAEVTEELDINVHPFSEEKRPGEIPVFDIWVAAGRWVDISD